MQQDKDKDEVNFDPIVERKRKVWGQKKKEHFEPTQRFGRVNRKQQKAAARVKDYEEDMEDFL